MFEFLLRLGDNALVLSHRLSQWCGHAPALEEDLATSNVALDLIGQARRWLDLAGEIEDEGRDADTLAYGRDARAFRNVLLVEQPNGDYAHTLARQFYFDAAQVPRLEALSGSGHEGVAAIAAKSLKEARYHLQRSRDWVVRLGDGTEESHARMQRAVDSLWAYTGEMFESDDVDRDLAGRGVAAAPSVLADPWRATIEEAFSDATLQVPAGGWMQSGGRRGLHSEHLGYILAEMQFLQRAYPGATW